MISRYAAVAASVALAVAGLTGSPACATKACQAGQADDFATSDGTEACAPSGIWHACLQQSTGGGAGQFDTNRIDRFVGHTFDLATCGSDADTLSTSTMVVVIHMRGVAASNSRPDNDYLLLGVEGFPQWGAKLSSLQCLRTGGADCIWSPNDTAAFVIDLQDLPPSDPPPSGWCGWPSGTTNMVALVGDHGTLDVGVSDDTMVDYVQVQFDAATPTRRSTWGDVKVRYR